MRFLSSIILLFLAVQRCTSQYGSDLIGGGDYGSSVGGDYGSSTEYSSGGSTDYSADSTDSGEEPIDASEEPKESGEEPTDSGEESADYGSSEKTTDDVSTHAEKPIPNFNKKVSIDKILKIAPKVISTAEKIKKIIEKNEQPKKPKPINKKVVTKLVKKALSNPKPAKKKVAPKPIKKQVAPKPTKKNVAPKPTKKQVVPKPTKKHVAPKPTKKQVASNRKPHYLRG